MAENDGGDVIAAAGDVLPEFQNVKDDGNNEGDQEDEGSTKPKLNRSVSCGSILQGNGMKIKNLSRRVSFPSDDKIISGYNEPKNPWEHAHDTTTEDLIQVYTQACQTWNVRPITKLLLQLQEITDFTVRANSLTLKGEKLEIRVVETLESIFKRVQFVTIDLEATNLDEDAAAALFDMIEYYESAVNVLAGFNKNLGNRGWQAAAHMLRKMSCLRLFDGHSVPLSIQASPFVGRALRLSNTLVTLHLENATLSGRPMLLIVAALRMNTTLRELFLADNRFAPLDALQLANLLKFNRILQLLDIRNNPVQDLGLGHLCAGLMAQSGTSGLNGPVGGLQTLVLWNNQISHEGMGKLAMALRYTVSLSTLNLGQNVLGDDGILRLKEGLLQNHSLLRLGLVGTKLTDEGAVAIAEYLAESPRIIRLDLRNNDIRVAGFMALSLAFKINSSLLRLDIDKPNKKDALKELAAKQESLLNDMIVYAARNKQAALEKAQAALQRQEEARRAQSKEVNGLRYMDMTNSINSPTTSTSVTEQSSLNNSNNQRRDMTRKVQECKGAHVQANSPTLTTVTTDTDDTPEDSPEFLPRSSVSYHQVAPVMLSNSEMAKRAAAAAKLEPLAEQHEEGTPPTERKFLNGALSKIVDDVFQDAKKAIVRQNKDKAPPSTVEEYGHAESGSGGNLSGNSGMPRHVNSSHATDSEQQSQEVIQEAVIGQEYGHTESGPSGVLSSNSDMPRQVNSTERSQEVIQEAVIGQALMNIHHTTETQDAASDGFGTRSAAARRSSDEHLHSFANDLSKVVIINATVHTEQQSQRVSSTEALSHDDRDAVMRALEPQDGPETSRANSLENITSDSTSADGTHGARQPISYDSNSKLLETPKAPLHSHEEQHASGDCGVSLTLDSKVDTSSKVNELHQDTEDDVIRALVSMATETTPEESDGFVEAFPSKTNTDGSDAENAVRKLVAATIDVESSHTDTQQPNADQTETAEGLTPDDLESSQEAIAASSSRDLKNEEIGLQTVENSTKKLQFTVTVVTEEITDDVITDQSSGIETATEDISTLSGDLSPMMEDVGDTHLGPKLLTPDSGIVQFDNVEKEGQSVTGGDKLNVGIHENDLKSRKPGGDAQISSSAEAENSDTQYLQSLTKNTVSDSQTLEISNFKEVSHKTPDMVLNLSQNFSQSNENSIDFVENNVCSKTTSEVLDSPCEVEVSHFDLNKFPSSD